LVLTVTLQHLVPEIERSDREQARAQNSEKERLVDLAVGQIQRFSYTKNKADVIAHVRANLEIGAAYALGLPISVLKIISHGISHFSR
jgi:hypothetical protein